MSDLNAQVVVDTATLAAAPTLVADGASAIVRLPAGGDSRVVDIQAILDRNADAPRRKTGVYEFDDADSFAEFVVRHAGTGPEDVTTELFADLAAHSVVAVFNGNMPTGAGWGDHRATFAMAATAAWARWRANDNRIAGQQAFAEHVENNLADIVDPDGAVLLEMAQTFQATTKVDFKSQKILASGQRQLTYEETIDAKAGQKGNLDIPAQFTLALQPFEGADIYRVVARLRFRITDGRLAIGYQLDRPDDVERSAFDDVLKRVSETTVRRVFLGRPAPGR